MIDSSYTIPSNPNSMRDNGPLRNAEYYITDEADKTMRESTKNFYTKGLTTVSSFSP